MYSLRRYFVYSCMGYLACAGSTGSALAQDLLDPTRPAGWQAAQQETQETAPDRPAALQLQGTFSSGGARSAMISGRRVVVGDRVSGAEILDIRADLVVLQADGEQFELVYGIPAVKAPVTRPGEKQ